MSKETRIITDMGLKANHLRKTLAWYDLKTDKLDNDIIVAMRNVDPSDPDCTTIVKCMEERDCTIENCKRLHKKIYG